MGHVGLLAMLDYISVGHSVKTSSFCIFVSIRRVPAHAIIDLYYPKSENRFVFLLSDMSAFQC